MAQLRSVIHSKKTLLSLFVAAFIFSNSVFAEDANVIKIDPQEELATEVGASEEGNLRYREGAEPQYQTTPPTMRESVRLEEVQPPKKQIFTINSDLLFGSSSNVARFEGAPSGSFTDFTPQIMWTPNLGERLDVALSVDAFLRTFQDQEIDELFRKTSVSGSGEATLFFENSFFGGLEGQFLRSEGRDIDFRDPNGSGRDIIFTNNQANAIFGRNLDNGFLVFNLGQEWERAETVDFDEAGNEFLSDYNQTHGGLRLQKQISDRFNLQAGYQLKYREFLSRRARLENGQVNPNFFDADRAEEIEHSIITTAEWRSIILELTYDYVGDMVTGAENRYSFGAVLAVPFKPLSFLVVRPEVGVENTFYENFVGDIFRRGFAIADGVDPETVPLNSTDERNDVMSFYGIDLLFETGVINPVISARHTEVTSNFSLIQFEEDVISGGIRLQF